MAGIKIGVLACQGSFREHVEALETLSKLDKGENFVLDVVEVRSEKDLKSDIKALIIPGGCFFYFYFYIYYFPFLFLSGLLFFANFYI